MFDLSAVSIATTHRGRVMLSHNEGELAGDESRKRVTLLSSGGDDLVND